MCAARAGPAFVVCTGWLLLAGLGETRGREHRPTLSLEQGVLIGVKVYPELADRAVNAYLGVPYAEPPVGPLRFGAPRVHRGWNGSLLAGSPRPSCVSHASDTTHVTSEDCLYLSVWSPEAANRLPVIVYLVGDEATADGPVPVVGHDLAAEWLVVVTVAFRYNIFGSFCLGSRDARGNLGLLDQYLALLWVHRNIVYFGGDPDVVTLAGHSSSAAHVLYHMASPRAGALFSRALLMSPSALSPWIRTDPVAMSRRLVRDLGCTAADDQQLLLCLRAKSQSEVMRAFQRQRQSARTDWRATLWPVVDRFLPEQERYLPEAPEQVARRGGLAPVPVLTGITDSVAATTEQWERAAGHDYDQLMQYTQEYELPTVMVDYGLNGSNARAVWHAIHWMYLEAVAETRDVAVLARCLRQLRWDSRVAAPHDALLRLLTAGPTGPTGSPRPPVYSYHLRWTTGAPDVDGKDDVVRLAGDLALVFGPALVQRVERRGFSRTEARLAKHLKQLWTVFAKKGAPDGTMWRPYEVSGPYVHALGGPAFDQSELLSRTTFWNELLPNVAAGGDGPQNAPPPTDSEGPRRLFHGADATAGFRNAVYTLLALALTLLTLLLICLVLLKRRSKEINRHFGF